MCVCVLQIVNHEPNKLIMLSAFACTLPARPLTRHGERLAHLTWGFLGVICIPPTSGCTTQLRIVGVVGSGVSGCLWYSAPFWVLNDILDCGCGW